jgi:excisionase family DNA binding protein
VTSNSDESDPVDKLLAGYPNMLSVSEVASILAIRERRVRELLALQDPNRRLPGFKLATTWRIAKEELREYLVKNHNHSARRPS